MTHQKILHGPQVEKPCPNLLWRRAEDAILQYTLSTFSVWVCAV